MWNGRYKYNIKNCENCEKEFKYPNFRPNVRFCSRLCFFNSGIISSDKKRGEKISNAMKGRVLSKEWRAKISKTRTGKKYPKLSEAKKGKKHTLEQKQKRSELYKKLYKDGLIKLPHRKGRNNSNWKGGISTEDHKLRTSAKFKKWREKVYTRDKFTCQKCGDDKGGNLHPHHIKFWHEYPKLRFLVSNGLTLCKKCHQEIHKGKNYGKNK